MRSKLKKIQGQRLRFRGTVDYFGEKVGWRGRLEPTLLLTEVRRVDNNETVTDHLWFTVRARIDSLALRLGDTIEFDARVSEYIKGYLNERQGIDERKVDYKLSYPSKLKRVELSTAPLSENQLSENQLPKVQYVEAPKDRKSAAEPSSFVGGEFAILTHPKHPYEGQVCRVLKATNSKFVLVDFADGYQAITADCRLSKGLEVGLTLFDQNRYGLSDYMGPQA